MSFGNLEYMPDALLLLYSCGTSLRKRKNTQFSYEEWHTSTPYDTFLNQSTYQTVCLLLYTWHRKYHCIEFCSKWIFDSNFEVAFPFTQDFLNYICRGNETDENKFIGVLHAIRVVPPEFFKEY